ncbi:hypothetical protein J6590_078471 [Homalodisca vitripennis]|nr:hypothetical protein J6590_078471 [Homalodisca vitripennis]
MNRGSGLPDIQEPYKRQEVLTCQRIDESCVIKSLLVSGGVTIRLAYTVRRHQFPPNIRRMETVRSVAIVVQTADLDLEDHCLDIFPVSPSLVNSKRKPLAQHTCTAQGGGARTL